MNEPAEHIRIGERLHGVDTALQRVALELQNLTGQVGKQNGRIGKIEEQITLQRVADAVAAAKAATREEVRTSFRKRDLAAFLTLWSAVLLFIEPLIREWIHLLFTMRTQ